MSLGREGPPVSVIVHFTCDLTEPWGGGGGLRYLVKRGSGCAWGVFLGETPMGIGRPEASRWLSLTWLGLLQSIKGLNRTKRRGGAGEGLFSLWLSSSWDIGFLPPSD